MGAGASLPAAHRSLREATRSEHAAAENTRIMRALLHGQLSLAGYTRLLHAYRRFYADWERQNACWLQGPLLATGWRYLSRTHALSVDLRQRDEPAAKAAASPLANSDSSGAWGELYVVEGSTLGGQVIARRLHMLFPAHGHRFFRLGEEAGQGSWQHFQRLLDRQLDDARRQQTAIDAARSMFNRIQAMLEGVTA